MRELRSWTAAAAGPAVAVGFYALATMRRRRSLHPVGIGYEGRLQVPDDGQPRPAAPPFQPGTTHPALLRFSRGAGLPDPLPDALGVAIKLPDAYGPGADQDLLLTSSTDRPLLRRLLFPASSFVRGAFSTALPYDFGGDRVVLLLVPAPTGHRRSADGGHRAARGALAELRAAADGLRFELRTARSFGRSQALATVTVGPPLPDDQTEALRFNPWTTGPNIHPAGWLNLLRDASYRSSQRARTRAPHPSRPPFPARDADRKFMAPWILAHGNGLDELGVLAFGSSLAVAVRLLIARRRTPDDLEPPVTEQHPDAAQRAKTSIREVVGEHGGRRSTTDR
jgi:hypothetical protein